MWLLQPRSLLRVGAACSYSSDVHVVTLMQLNPSFDAEYALSSSHEEHLRLAIEVPAAVWP